MNKTILTSILAISSAFSSISMAVDVSSNDYNYYRCTFTVDVYRGQNVENITHNSGYLPTSLISSEYLSNLSTVIGEKRHEHEAQVKLYKDEDVYNRVGGTLAIVDKTTGSEVEKTNITGVLPLTLKYHDVNNFTNYELTCSYE